jgi:hypothetical protein
MPGIYHRTSRVQCRADRYINLFAAYSRCIWEFCVDARYYAALNNGPVEVGGLGSDAGGETGERHDTASGVDRCDDSEIDRGSCRAVGARGAVT